MWTNLFAVAGIREHPPAGVIRKRGRSAPSCAQCGRAGRIPVRPAWADHPPGAFYRLSASESQSTAHASDGMRQSPRGDSETEPTFTPSGTQLRLNCCEKKRR